MLYLDNITQRNNIPASSRFEGLQVRVLDVQTTFVLSGGVTDDDWIPLPSSGRPDYLEPDSTVTIYVQTWGDDGYGDGSSDNPYRQPQRALDDVPLNAIGEFIIQCGVGTFDMPVIPHTGSNGRLLVNIFGNRSNPTVSLDGISFSQKSGKFAQDEATVSFSGTVNDGTHWAHRDLSSLDFVDRGYISLSSTSPTLNIVSDSTPTSFMDNLYPIETIFEITDVKGSYVCNIKSHDDGEGKAASLFGINIALRESAHTILFDGFNFQGCRFDVDGSFTTVIITDCISCRAMFSDGVLAEFVGGKLGAQVSGVLAVSSLGVYGSRISGLVTRESSGNEQLLIKANRSLLGVRPTFASVELSGVDFEGTTGCLLAKGAYIDQRDDISISNSPSSGFNVTLGSIWEVTNGIINGDISGDAFVLEDGSQAVGIKAACDGTLTSSGGAEIKVGGSSAPANDFADLPITDLDSGCRAT